MKILILGASSYVGARLFIDLRDTFNVVGTYAKTPLSSKFIQLNVTDEKRVLEVITHERPDFIVHAANSADARWCEAHPDAAQRLNERSTTFIVNAANSISAHVIYISSFAAIHPENVYGHTKRASEELVLQTKAGYAVLRPSLILGFSPNTTNDRPFNRLLKNLDQATPAIYDASWKFQPTYIRHISEVIQQVIERKIIGEVIPVAVPELASRFETARDILGPFGVAVQEVDKQDPLKTAKEDLSALIRLGLPTYSYSDMITEIGKEIRNRAQFSLN